MFKGVPISLRRMWYSIMRKRSFQCFLEELAYIAKFLVLIGTFCLFAYAIFYPSTWIILILFIFFLAALALVEL
ncbi:hypothetical protein [Desulfuribacillus alkaliarsenatis]|uniref:Uncharacterized protein n=1 Tax=Desulfuribacillus alkaliarsenatis TaxID=766136 RepID=A0A1E5G6C9_9FIRM|nr:hypothetical protein [Desulfuribacillus alkaliarsenatis]OEF98726.1 hypothetical protein BHF68_03445 [Desulfuribacillus alkaliarsenatis]